MKKTKKLLLTILIFITILLTNCNVFATDFSKYAGKMEYSEQYLKYLELSEEEQQKVIVPRMYEIPKTRMTITNPLKLARMVGSSTNLPYSLRDIIPENMVIKDQTPTQACWTFSMLATLESTLALKDYKNGIAPVVYDFSERHMEYATSETFLNNVKNPIGFYREVDSGGHAGISIPYLTNGTGAIAETEMPFEPNAESIYITEIQDKTVIAQVNDTINFPSYTKTDDKTEIIKQMKQHLKNYGAIDTCIYGAKIDANSPVYNSETGAIYCPNDTTYGINHAVAIVGWDDSYSVDNFASANKPTNPGAWIIKNSWGTGGTYTLEEMKEYIFEKYQKDCINLGWDSAQEIPDEDAIYNFTNWGATIENNVATWKIGDEGFMYVSYEDANIYIQMTGITNAQNEVTYENIYQYDQYAGYWAYPFASSKVYLATVFDRKTSGAEYITQVSINAPEKYTCKVYVNPNGESKAKGDLQQVELLAGESETFEAGYHTIEFLNPVKLNSDKFVVVLEIEGTAEEQVSVLTEFNFGEFINNNPLYANNENHIYDNVVVETGKCFVAFEEDVELNQWTDTSTMKTINNGNAPDFDTTIKAFTTSKILESIEVTTPPLKTKYIVGDDFDKTGMVVTGKYANGKTEEITDYVISNEKDLKLGQTEITITYEGKTTTQSIEVVENVLEEIKITTPATKTEYFAGENFDATGMVVTATYTDKTTAVITDYEIIDGTTLKNGQTEVTISYEGKTAKQAISVKENNVIKLEIEQVPNKVDYVVGQNFNAEGMIVKATYVSGLEKEITNYTILDGENLTINQTSVTIQFEGQTVTQEITVVEKTITGISVKTMPTKLEYIQNKEQLDLTNGTIEVLYNDETKEELSMISDDITIDGFSNEEPGIKTITITYKNYTTQFDITIKELEKPKNSNFDDIKANVQKISTYNYTDENKKEHTIISVELNDIIKAFGNENMEYYYYLSKNPAEENIADWIKINILQNEGNKIQFEINTSDISNYEELVNADTIYLYVKEVAIKNEMTSEKISIALALKVENVNVENFLDGEKVEITDSEPTPGEKEDNTTAPGIIPNAGKNMLIITLVISVLFIGRLAYKKYEDIEIK